MSTVVMAGNLGEFDVPSVLQAVSLTRQCTVIRLWDQAKRPTGEIRVKSGQLLDASHESLRGKAAFRAIMQGTSHSSFRVERVRDAATANQPVGSLSGLLLEVATAEPEAAAPAVVPIRPIKAGAPPVRTAPATTPAVAQLAEPAVIGSFAGNFVEVLEAATPLEGVVLVQLPECREARAWQRTNDNPGTENLLSFVAGIVVAQKRCFGEWDALGGRAPATFELPTGTVVLEQVTQGHVLLCRFARGVPLGLVRLVGAEVKEATITALGQEVERLRASGI